MSDRMRYAFALYTIFAASFVLGGVATFLYDTRTRDARRQHLWLVKELVATALLWPVAIVMMAVSKRRLFDFAPKDRS